VTNCVTIAAASIQQRTLTDDKASSGTGSTISHHLKVLHDSGLVGREKRGVWVYYRARTEALASLGALIGH
jgi:DNA-binding transcriptional ArsR family regulator